MLINTNGLKRAEKIFYDISREDYNRVKHLIWEWKVFYGKVGLQEPTIQELIEFIARIKKW
jgi:hypothetical protein